MGGLKKFLVLIGRLSLSAIFILSAINKIFAWQKTETALINLFCDWQSYVSSFPALAKLFSTLISWSPEILMVCTIVELVAALFELERLLIGKAIYNTTDEGAATQTYAYIFGKHGLMSYAPPRPGLRIPSAGYIFTWKKFGGISYIRRLRDEKGQYDRIEGHTFFDQKAVSTDCGYFMENLVN